MSPYDLREIRAMRRKMEYAAQQLVWAEEGHRSGWEQNYRVGLAGHAAQTVVRKARNAQARYDRVIWGGPQQWVSRSVAATSWTRRHPTRSNAFVSRCRASCTASTI